VGVVRTPRTDFSSTSSESTGKPGKTFTPSSSAFSPSQRQISEMDAVKFPALCMGGGVGMRTWPRLGEHVDRLAAHGVAEGEVASFSSGKSSRKARGFTTAPGEVVLAQRRGLVEHGDLRLAQRAARLRVLLHQARQLDGAGEPRRPRAHDHHVHRHDFILLGLRGQAKTRILRQLVEPPGRRDPGPGGKRGERRPLLPISKFGRQLLEEAGRPRPGGLAPP
jgi:hypothetical protein